jgi:hypothetical protein
MTHFAIDQQTDQPDRIHVEIDRRFDITIVRTCEGIELCVYPRTAGLLWDDPFAVFAVDDQEIIALEAKMQTG